MTPVIFATASTPDKASTIPVKMVQPSHAPCEGDSKILSCPEKIPAALNPSKTRTAGSAKYTATLPANRGPNAFSTPKAKMVRIAQRTASAPNPK